MRVAPILDRFGLRRENPKDNTLPSVFRMYSKMLMPVLNFEIRFACCFIDILEWEEEKKNPKRNLPYYSNQSPNTNHFLFLFSVFSDEFFCFAMFNLAIERYNSLIYWHSYILLLRCNIRIKHYVTAKNFDCVLCKVNKLRR